MVAASDCACIRLQNYSMTEVNKSLLKANLEDALTTVVPTSENTCVELGRLRGIILGAYSIAISKPVYVISTLASGSDDSHWQFHQLPAQSAFPDMETIIVGAWVSIVVNINYGNTV